MIGGEQARPVVAESMDELVVGKWKILEPPRERWGEPGRRFGRSRLISWSCRVWVSAARAAGWGTARVITTGCSKVCGPIARWLDSAYECQLFDNLIVSPHDVFMDKVVTERAVYEGQGRRANG